MGGLVEVSLPLARAHVLVKQGLAGGGLAGVPDAVVRTAGIYGTAPTCYLSCAARVPGFRLADLDAELYERRCVVRLRCMRLGMNYIEPVELLPVLVACTGEAPDRTLARVVKYGGLSEPRALALADRVEGMLAGRPPMTLREIRDRLAADGGEPAEGPALQLVVGLLGRTARIVRAEVRGSWRSDAYTYARWADWLAGPVRQVDPAAARPELARRYLRAYGPATTDDLKWWTGWSKRDTVAALAALAGDLAEVSLAGAPAWLLADELADLDALAPDPASAAAGVRLLPVWDSYFMGYAKEPAARARQVRESDYGRVYDKAGNGTSTVIAGGLAAGVWQLDADAGIVMVAPFDSLPWDEVERQVAALATAIGTDLRLRRHPEPAPLAASDARNAFLSPITLGKPA